MFDFFKKRSDVDNKFDNLHKSLDVSFSKIKDDMNSVGEWIKHLDEHKKHHHSRLEEIDSRLRAVESMLRELNVKEEFVSEPLSKHKQTVVRPNSLSKRVQTAPTPVQTAVQTDLHSMLVSLTPMERTVVWALLNTDIKLSYSDLSNLLGKDESTVRGQLTNIKRKVPWLLEEISESNGKKRFVVPEDIKERVIAQYAQKRAKKDKK